MLALLAPTHSLVLCLAIVVLFLAFKLLKKRATTKSCLPLPPGPPPLPLIGNLLDLPTEYDWIHWGKHKVLYGPISSVSVMGKTIILVSDAKIAMELLDKRSSNFSDRPIFPFAGEM